MFGELIKSYTENLEPDPYAPRQQPTSVLTAMLRLLGGLLPEVSAKIKYGLPFKEASSCLEAAILFSVVWAFEPSLPAKARAFFNILVRKGREPRAHRRFFTLGKASNGCSVKLHHLLMHYG